MTNVSFLELFHNCILLLAVVLIVDVFFPRRCDGQRVSDKILIGLLAGSMGIVIMMAPWIFITGVVFDARSVLISLSGLFFGFLPTLIAMVMTSVFRLYLGGVGTLTGVIVILASGAIGMVWRHYRHGSLQQIRLRELYGFGLIVHMGMMVSMFALPREVVWEVFAQIAVPVLVLYPIGTVFLGMLLVNRIRRGEAEGCLRISEEKHRLLADHTLDVIWMMTMDLEFTYVNTAALRLFGYTPEEFIGTRLPQHCAPEKFARMAGLIEQEVRKGPAAEGVVFETELIHKNGGLIPVEIHGQVIFDEAGRPAALQGTTRDITERCKARQELQQRAEALDAALREALQSREILVSMLEDNTAIREELERNLMELKRVQEMFIQSQKMAAVGQLSAGVAHEVKNPLSIILLSLEGLERNFSGMDDKGRQYIQMIKNAAERANKVVMGLMNFARYSEMQIADVWVLQVVQESVALIENSARIQGARFICEFSCPGDVLIGGDAQLLEQVFLNLFSNAIDAVAGREGIITVRVSLPEEPAGVVLIEVRDNGCGIPEELRDRIFDPFFTTKAVGQGTGLGLSMVFSIIENHKGTIRVESGPDRGTAFFITLPVKAPEVNGEGDIHGE